jgi:hypothetical protein
MTPSSRSDVRPTRYGEHVPNASHHGFVPAPGAVRRQRRRGVRHPLADTSFSTPCRAWCAAASLRAGGRRARLSDRTRRLVIRLCRKRSVASVSDMEPPTPVDINREEKEWWTK